MGQASWVLFALILVTAAAFRIVLYRLGHFGFDADQADGGILALRFLGGGPHTVFVTGQNYNGNIWPHYFLPLHLIFPPSVALMRLGVLPLTLAIGASLFWMIREVFGNLLWAFVSMTLFLFPSSMMVQWTMHSGSHYIFVLIGINLATVFLGRALRGQGVGDARSATARRLLGFGFVGGFCYWVHFSMLIYLLAALVAVLAHPRHAAELTGLWRPDAGTRRGLDPLSAAVQLAFLFSLAMLTHTLLVGAPSGEQPSVLPALSVALALLALRLEVSWRVGREARAWHLVPLAAFVGLWVGASPVIWHIHGLGLEILPVEGHVDSWRQFLTHLRAALVEGVPVLLGFRHDFGHVAAGVWIGSRGFALGVGAACLVVLPIAAAAARLRRSHLSFGLSLASALLILQLLAFSYSQHGWFAANPRYIMPVQWAAVVAMGGAAAGLAHRVGRSVRWLALVPVVGLVGHSVWLNLDSPRYDMVGWSGEAPDERDLINFLLAHDLHRVSTRFDISHGYGHWAAYPLTYIAGEEVIFAPSDEPGHARIRSQYYQVVVNSAPRLAYLLPTGDEADTMTQYLTARSVSCETAVCGRFTVFYDLRPDILHDLRASDYEKQTSRSDP
jgi:hypothetical protein